jgi:hypothetical protein
MIAEAILFSFIKNNLIKMQTSASRRVNILYIYFKIRSFLITCSTKKGYIAQDDLYLAKTTLIGRNLGICYCVPKSNRKIAATGISVPIVHIFITAHFPDLAQGVQYVRIQIILCYVSLLSRAMQ